MTRRIMNLVFGQRLRLETTRYLEELASAPARISREQSAAVLKKLASVHGPTVTLGTTALGQSVRLPINEILTSSGLVTGASGSGKTYAILLILRTLIEQLPQNQSFGFGILDPKSELFEATLYLLAQRLADLDRNDPQAAAALRRRIVILDFSAKALISEYNILARPADIEPGFFAASRADLLGDLMAGNDSLSLNGNAVLRKVVRLLVENNLPATWIEPVLHNDSLRGRLVANCDDEEFKNYFARFHTIPSQVINALSRRVESLFAASESVRLALSGSTAPDFRSLQDQGKIILANCFGKNLSRSVAQLLQALVLSDVRHGVFSRRRKDSFLWVLDESQVFFGNERLRDHMNDLLCLARSFGSFFICLTQNVSTAVHDARMLANILTNSKWTLSLRSQPADCAFLKPALAVTGRRLRPQINPFEEPGFYSLNEERAMELESVASLPDRTGFLWLRSRSDEALKITTETLAIPRGEALESAIEALRSDPEVGGRVTREIYEAKLRRRKTPQKESPSGFADSLAGEYKRRRGGAK